MAVIRSWSGDGLEAGALDAGVDDDAFDIVTDSGQTVVESGDRPPRLALTQVSSQACNVGWQFTSQSQGAGRFYITTPPSWSPASHSICAILVDGSTTAMRIDISGSAAPGQLRLRNSSATVDGTSNGTIVPATTYRIEWTIDQGAGTAEVYLYNEDDELLDTLTGTPSGAAHTRVLFGNVLTSPTPGVIYMDDLAVADEATLIGPVEPEPIEVTPDEPTFEDNTITIPVQAGVIYQIGGSPVSGEVPITEDTTVTAVPDDGYVFANGATDSWQFVYVSPLSPADGIRPLAYNMNRVAGTLDERGLPTLSAQGAAQVWSGTSLALQGALNVKAGNPRTEWVGLQEVLNQLAGTHALGIDAASSAILA